MHKMRKKVEKTSLYRLSFEICSVTHFFKIPTFGDTNPIAPPPSMPSLILIERNLEVFWNSLFIQPESRIKSQGAETNL